jgi:hypothetical protein
LRIQPSPEQHPSVSPASDAMASPLVDRYHLGVQEVHDCLRCHPRDDGDDRVRVGGIAGRELPDLAHALQFPEMALLLSPRTKPPVQTPHLNRTV